MQSYYQNLDVWKKAIDFIEQIYIFTAKFPKEEIYGITSQMRRAAVSIASNIAEWSWKQSNPDFIRYLYISKGSAMEIETQIIISKRLWYIDNVWEEQLLWDNLIILKMLTSLIASISKNYKP